MKPKKSQISGVINCECSRYITVLDQKIKHELGFYGSINNNKNGLSRYARANNVTMMTFDNEAELHKVKQHHPQAQMIIRIKVDDSKSLCKVQ